MANIAFRPVRCLESALETMTPVDGHVVFTTDTKKIYAAIDGEFKMMGGSSGVFYGTRELTDDEKYGDEVFFIFLPEHIDGNTMPAVDDLILNIPDGGFYRVLESDEATIQAQRLAISGGGGGTGGGGGPSNEGSLVINYITPQNSSTITGVDYYIDFEIVAKDSAGDLIGDKGTATWKIGTKQITEEVSNGKNSFKVDEYLDPTQSSTKITLVVSMNTGGSANTIVSKTWYVKAVSLSLAWDYKYNEINYINDDKFTLNWYSYGGVECVAHIIFDDNYNPGVTYFTKAHKATGSLVTSDQMPSLEYGSHKCEIYLTTEVNGETYQTPSIYNEITFIKGKTSTILTVPYYEKTATQYDTLRIPFMVYDPDLEACEVGFYVNDNLISSDSYNRELQYWPYTLTDFGTVKLSIKTINGEAQKDIELVVNKLELEAEEAEGYAFSLKANSFSSNNELRNWNQDGITLTFSDGIHDEYQPFDWENGGLKFEEKEDGSIEKYICVRQGTRMTINYPLFGRDANSVLRDGKTFKICFKATNCYDYEAPFLECYEEVSKIGIKLDAQKALFSTSTYPNFTSQYCENAYIELETEIWPDTGSSEQYPKNPGDRFLMIWIDGVPAGVKPFSPGEVFKQSNPKYITIGSDLCDTYIYVVKTYERRLTENEHLDNFIMDAPSTEEMLKRYRRNDILDNAGEISYERLVQQNPDCHAYVYRIPKMTTSKDDKVGGCDYFELYGEYNTADNPYYRAVNTGDGARIRVQGTSSAAYGVAAFNLRTEFQEGLIDKDGNQVEGWEINDTAIPIDYVCTKVNVASCENANNVVNQEWYNKFQPYYDAHRRKTREDGRKYRDCMEFNSGVVFILDENDKTGYLDASGKPDRETYLNSNIFLDTKDYTTRPFYKQYAIGNMGNDKKNTEVFHDKSNPKVCCVENADNQKAAQQMITRVDRSVWEKDENGKYTFEFRYPDGNEKASDEMKDAFEAFVNWMADSNPKAATGEPLPEPVTFEPYTFRGYAPPGYDIEDNPSGVSLKGLTIKTYSTTKNTKVPVLDENGDQVIDENGNLVFETEVIPYTYDTYEYRMAKMLSECEDHLVMDSVVFHYLFIQRHTMVDNVAKNTFWSTEDLQHWDLTKNYDNDTSDGNNNSGYLTFSYGIEALDKNEAGDDIYNAAPSVWANFIHGLYDAQKELHKQLEGKGAWAAELYLNEFKKHQEIIPERCWIQNYFHHYIRPRRLGLDEDTYLNRLEGGKKTHQRNQYETYQDFYINSKYIASAQFTESTAVDLRLNSSKDEIWDTENKIATTYYIDCYASALIGGISNQSGRLKRGEKYYFPVGTMLSDPHDATCYFFGAKMVQSFEGLAKTRPNYITVTGAPKLRRLELGSDEEGYYNPNLTGAKIGQNHMLQQALIQNSGKPEGMGDLDLKELYQLNELRLNGSTATGLILANGGVLETLYLNPLSSLEMENLSKLNDIHLDEGIYDSLNKIIVKNCPAMDENTYQLSLTAPILNYTITDFNWNIEDADTGFEIENNKVVGFSVLDKLLTANPLSGASKTSLIGTINVEVNGNIDEYEIYKKYCKQYPNVIIRYNSDVVTDLDPAVELLFLTDEQSGQTHYRVLGSGLGAAAGGESIAKLISADGPLGEAMTTPMRQSTADEVFTFTGRWYTKDADGNKTYYCGENDEKFEDLYPETSMTFYPEFTNSVRTYEVKFLDYDGNVIPQNGNDVFMVPYGFTYKAAGGPMVNFYYKDSSKLKDEERYAFRGWSTNKYGIEEIKNPVYIDLEKDQITGPLILYPHYVIENATKVASNIEYFNINGDTISLKDEYKETLQGKITIPTIVGVTKVGGFGNGYGSQSKITHIYFLADSKIDTIGSSAFAYCGEVEIINLPNTVKAINDYAFTSCSKLVTVTLNDNITIIGANAFSGCGSLQLNNLPANLITLGSGAFQSGGEGIRITVIPSGVQTLESWTFNGCPNVKITTFGGANGESNLTTIKNNCFNSAGNGSIGNAIEEIVINYSVESIEALAFYDYGYKTLKNVYFARPYEGSPAPYGTTPYDMGFTGKDINFGQLENG